MTTEVYGTSLIKRERRTRDDIYNLKKALVEVLAENTTMTVRQVFYQMTSRGYIPKTEKAYKSVVCRLLKDLRLDGTIPFGCIADNTRWMRKQKSYDDMQDALRTSLEAYRRALWSRMSVYVEVWIEKDALAGVLYDITNEWDVPLMVTRGFSSLTYLYEAAEQYKAEHKPVYVYYLGDFDPSGMVISRSVEQRLREFAPGVEIHFERCAVTSEQIETLNLPTRPTKTSDTNARNFNSDYSVELDSIPPLYLRNLVEVKITQHINEDEYVRVKRIESLEKESLKNFIRGWNNRERANL